DLYLPADDSYTRLAQEKELLAEVFPLAEMKAVLLVRPGNPKKVTTWDDLLREGVKLGQANPDAAAIGKLTRDRLRPNGLWEPLKARTAIFQGTVNEVANAVKTGSLDAGIVWDAVAFQYPEFAVVRLPELEGVTARVELAVLKRSTQPTAALRFARYVAAKDKGLKDFQR